MDYALVMSFSTEFAALFRRDLLRLVQQIETFPEEALLWQHAPGVTNSAGNLVLHLEGNLRDFIGRVLGGVEYQRQRDHEFSAKGISRVELEQRAGELAALIPKVLEAMTAEQLDAVYPINVLGKPLSTRQFLIHLNGHFNYHLGQIDYLRRFLTAGNSVQYLGL